MAAIGNTYSFSAGPSTFATTGSNAYLRAENQLLAVAGAIPANGTYLVMCRAVVGGTNTTRRFLFRLVHGDSGDLVNLTAFTDSEIRVEPALSSATSLFREQLFTYMTVYTASSGAEDIVFQGRLLGGRDGRGHAADMEIQVIRLDAALTENIDYYFSEVTADAETTTAFAEGAKVTVAPGAAGNWLVIAHINYDVGATSGGTTASFETRLHRKDSGGASQETAPLSRREGEDNQEVLSQTLVWSYNLSAGDNPIALEFRDEAAGGSFNHRSSRIFALRLDAFEHHQVDVQASSVTPTSDITLAAVTVTPPTDGDYLYLGHNAMTANAEPALLCNQWLEEDSAVPSNTPGSGTWVAVAYEAAAGVDLPNVNVFTLQSLTSAGGSKLIELHAAASTAAVSLFQERCLVAFSMNLSSASASQTIQLEAAALTATGVEPGFSFGGIDVSVGVASLAATAPVLVAAPGNLNVALEAASLAGTGVAVGSSIGNLNVALEAAVVTLTAPAIGVFTGVTIVSTDFDGDANASGGSTTDGNSLRVEGSTSTANSRRRVYIRFPIASIPSSPPVTKVVLRMKNNSTFGTAGDGRIQGYHNVSPGQSDPAVDSGAVQYTRCKNGTAYFDDQVFDLTQSYDLGAAAIVDLQAAVDASATWFSLGLSRTLDEDAFSGGHLLQALDAGLGDEPKLTVTVSDVQIVLTEVATLALSAPALTIASSLTVAVEAATLSAVGVELASSVPLTVLLEAASLTATAPALDSVALSNINVSVGVADLAFAAPVIVVQEAQNLVLVGKPRFINPTQYPSTATLRIEVRLAQDSVSTTVEASLFNVTDGVTVSGTTVSTTNTEKTDLQSAFINLSTFPQSEKKYQIQFGGAVGGSYRWHASDIAIVSS